DLGPLDDGPPDQLLHLLVGSLLAHELLPDDHPGALKRGQVLLRRLLLGKGGGQRGPPEGGDKYSDDSTRQPHDGRSHSVSPHKKQNWKRARPAEHGPAGSLSPNPSPRGLSRAPGRRSTRKPRPGGRRAGRGPAQLRPRDGELLAGGG